MTRQTHWDAIYDTKSDRQLSWFEALPAVSLRLMEAAGLTPDTCVLDVGGGDSRLIDHLAARGVTCLAVLDVSGSALRRARARLGDKSGIPTWIEADVTGEWSLPPVDIWHDRAVFHFLTDETDRGRYVERLQATLKPGGTAIIATFALDGPETCSGLAVSRYSPESLGAALGPQLRLVEAVSHHHTTPSGATQSLQYSRFRYGP
jgi:SAM-dependent methyltransferase